MSEFYVYVIFRRNGSPCYVGKGKGRRFKVTTRTNKHLRAIAAKCGPLPVVKIRNEITEEQAFETEKALIQAIKQEKDGGPLINLTEGGEGFSGGRHSDAVRQKMAERMKKIMADPIEKARRIKMMKKTLATTEARKLKVDVAKEVGGRPEIKERRKAIMLERMSDPIKKAQILSVHKGRKCSPETIAKMRASAKKRFHTGP